MDLLVGFWKSEKTIEGVLVLNALFPGLGVVYAGGAAWALVIAPFWLMLLVTSIGAGPITLIAFLPVVWFISSIVGCAIIWVRNLRNKPGLPNPGPNTSNLSVKFGRGEGKGLTVSALETLEQKVKRADEMLKVTRELELENAKSRKLDQLPLSKETPSTGEGPPSVEPLRFDNLDPNKLPVAKDKDAVVRKSPVASQFAPPAEQSLKLLTDLCASPAEPALTPQLSEFAPPAESQFMGQSSEFGPSLDLAYSATPPNESAFAEPRPEQAPAQPQPAFNQQPSEVVPLAEPKTTELGFEFPRPGELELTDRSSDLVFPDEFDLEAMNSADASLAESEFASKMESAFEIPTEAELASSDGALTNEMSLSLPQNIADQSVKVDAVADAKFALSSAQSPEKIQKFFEKLGETVGTSYQQEPLTKPLFDISFPSFESPNFSFDFSGALSSDFASIAGTSHDEPGEMPSKDNCQRCGVAKHTEFTFCLGCGISY